MTLNWSTYSGRLEAQRSDTYSRWTRDGFDPDNADNAGDTLHGSQSYWAIKRIKTVQSEPCQGVKEKDLIHVMLTMIMIIAMMMMIAMMIGKTGQ